MNSENAVPEISDLAREKLLAKLAQLRKAPTQQNNELLLHLYAAASFELYIDYFAAMKAVITAWGVDVRMEIPRDLPAYFVVCPHCGAKCGELELIKQHKLLASCCGYCPEDIKKARLPIIDGYALGELAKLMKQDVKTVEHFIAAAILAKKEVLA